MKFKVLFSSVLTWIRQNNVAPRASSQEWIYVRSKHPLQTHGWGQESLFILTLTVTEMARLYAYLLQMSMQIKVDQKYIFNRQLTGNCTAPSAARQLHVLNGQHWMMPKKQNKGKLSILTRWHIAEASHWLCYLTWTSTEMREQIPCSFPQSPK